LRPSLIIQLLPLIAIQLALMIFALIDLARRRKVARGSKLLWAIIIIFINVIGPILYFILGRAEEE
jgi:hypothetical protein